MVLISIYKRTCFSVFLIRGLKHSPLLCLFINLKFATTSTLPRSVHSKGVRMTLTKADLIETIQSNNGLTKKQSTAFVEATIDLIKKTLHLVKMSWSAALVSSVWKKKRSGKAGTLQPGITRWFQQGVLWHFKCSGKLRARVNSD